MVSGGSVGDEAVVVEAVRVVAIVFVGVGCGSVGGAAICSVGVVAAADVGIVGDIAV